MNTIDLSAWTLFSERYYTKSYISPDGLTMLKTVDASNELSVANLQKEYEIAVISNSLGVPTAKAYDIVTTSNNEVGIIYDYIRDKISCSRAISREPERLEEFVKIFTAAVKKMHAVEADTTRLSSFESKVFAGLDNTTLFSDKEKDIIRERFITLPKDTKCIHGDMTMSNVIHAPSGDIVIDLGMLSYGNPVYDVAYFYNHTRFMADDIVQKLFHFDLTTLKKCWEVYAKEYFESSNLREIEEYIIPYAKFASLPLLTIDGNMPSVAAAKEFILSE